MKAAYHSIVALERARILRAPESTQKLDFLRGAAIADAPDESWVFDVEFDSARLPHFVGGAIPMASARLLTVLSKLGIDNIQTFPALVRVRGGAESREHSVLNVIGLLDAADAEASVDGNLVLSPARTLGLSVFRLFHDSRPLIVDDRLLRALEQQKPAGGWGFAALELAISDLPKPV